MYFATFAKDGKTDIGVLTADKKAVLPLAAAEKHVLGSQTLPATMLELLDAGQPAVDTVAKILATADDKCPKLALSEVKLLAPIPRPRKNIFCIGKNYREHAMEFEKVKDESAIPKHPVIFSKPPTTVIGPEAVIDSHSEVTQGLDYEVELAVVIGREGTNIPQAKAMDYVFGYTIMNDVTARDLQKRHSQWLKGKGLDTFAPMGPFLVHKSAVADVTNLKITSKVNGELRQNANTGDLIFSIPVLIETLSAGITLEPGDLIATGTPAGVGGAMTPPKYLKAGDKLELEITGLGALKNTVG